MFNVNYIITFELLFFSKHIWKMYIQIQKYIAIVHITLNIQIEYCCPYAFIKLARVILYLLPQWL